jgi:hypothetical protein
MKRRFGAAVLMASVLAVLVSGCMLFNFEPTRQPPSSVPTPTTTTPSATPDSEVTAGPVRTPPAEPIVEGGDRATDLRSLGFCEPDSPSTAAMALTWRSAATGEQLVAVATLPDGFESGRYTVSENLPAEQQEYTISPVEPGGVYYWRVLTRSGDGWTASEIATFTGPTCVVDAP